MVSKYYLEIELVDENVCIGCYCYSLEPTQSELGVGKVYVPRCNILNKIVHLRPTNCPLKPVEQARSCSTCKHAHEIFPYNELCRNCHNTLKNNWEKKDEQEQEKQESKE